MITRGIAPTWLRAVHSEVISALNVQPDAVARQLFPHTLTFKNFVGALLQGMFGFELTRDEDGQAWIVVQAAGSDGNPIPIATFPAREVGFASELRVLAGFEVAGIDVAEPLEAPDDISELLGPSC